MEEEERRVEEVREDEEEIDRWVGALGWDRDRDRVR